MVNIQVLSNILKFLERVTTTGSESYAWVEAHQYVQGEITRLAQDQITSQSKAE